MPKAADDRGFFVRGAVFEYSDRMSWCGDEVEQRWRVRDREIVLETPGGWSIERSVRTRVGDSREHAFCRVIDADFVHVIAVDESGRVLLIREFHHGCERSMLTLPGGGVDSGETYEQAARREFREETGYEAESWTDLGGFWPSPKRQSNFGRAFVAHGLRRVGEPTPDDTEDFSGVVFLSERDVRSAVRQGLLAGGFSMACLLLWEWWRSEAAG